jgi:predicted alpha/beta hydrolase family esterase
VDKIFLYQSKDDPEVSFHDAEKYKRDLPKAELIIFEDRGHFLQQDFFELIENIKK